MQDLAGAKFKSLFNNSMLKILCSFCSFQMVKCHLSSADLQVMANTTLRERC